MINHVIRTMSDMDQDTCEWQCYLDHNCVSINLQFEGTQKNCELNNSTHNEHHEDLIAAHGHFYRGTEVSAWAYIGSFSYPFLDCKLGIGNEVFRNWVLHGIPVFLLQGDA